MNDRSEKPQRSLRETFLEAAEIEEASARAAFLDVACASVWSSCWLLKRQPVRRERRE